MKKIMRANLIDRNWGLDNVQRLHHNEAVCCFVPDYVFEQVIRDGSREERDKAIHILKLSERLRSQRHFVSATDPRRFGIGGHTERRRVVYDMHNIGDDNLLPGDPVRYEDSTDTGDSNVDKCFNHTGSVYDFYNQIFSRNSIDGEGMAMYSSVHFDEDLDNAFWNGRQMTYGNGGGGFIKPGTLTDLIVVAHELTHGVTQYESNLAYSGQPGGLNESMSDVFAIMCDQWVNKQTVNDSHWLIGKDIMVRGGALRSMKNPGGAHPGDRQVSHVRDYREGMGPHQCSGIPNKAFYTACMKVGGNSYETIGKIWYIALKDRLSRLSQFQDAANHTYTIAAELFGEDSNEQKAVASGWSEVGVEARKPTVEEITVGRKKLLSKIDSRLGT
jgi:Zn-dependent metalloprotease